MLLNIRISIFSFRFRYWKKKTKCDDGSLSSWNLRKIISEPEEPGNPPVHLIRPDRQWKMPHWHWIHFVTEFTDFRQLFDQNQLQKFDINSTLFENCIILKKTTVKQQKTESERFWNRSLRQWKTSSKDTAVQTGGSEPKPSSTRAKSRAIVKKPMRQSEPKRMRARPEPSPSIIPHSWMF